VFCPGVEQWAALVVFLWRFVLVYIPTFRCADFSRELWAGLHGAASMALHIRGYCSRLLVSSFFLSSHLLYVQCLRHGDCIVSEFNGKSI